MLLIPCPWCGPRNVDEFAYSGPPTPRPEPDTVTPPRWRAYLYQRDNTAQWTRERWFHRHGCYRYFVVRRHATTNQITPDTTEAPLCDCQPDRARSSTAPPWCDSPGTPGPSPVSPGTPSPRR